jgi:BNR repeat-containing family member
MNDRLLFLWVLAIMLTTTAKPASAADSVNGNLILFNDNGAWCWFQDPRAIYDPVNNSLLIGSIAVSDGLDGDSRGGDVDLVTYKLSTGERDRFVLRHKLLTEDDHNAPALLIRPDGRYLAMYSKHNQEGLSYWRVSENPNDSSTWRPEMAFDWNTFLEAAGADNHVTYHNVFYLKAENRTYDFTRAVNLDPSILLSTDHGSSWSFSGKLFTEPRVGYVNGYTKYASNGVDRIDFITTEHHPRDFNNSVYHGYLKDGKLHRSDGTVIDEHIIGGTGKSQTNLTKIFAASSVFNGETMTHAWTADIQLDPAGRPCAIITARANDEPDNTNFDDHRFFYARYDGSKWNVVHLAKAGARLWDAEQDYTGLAAIDPADSNVVYVSTPIDPRTDKPLGKLKRGQPSSGRRAVRTWAHRGHLVPRQHVAIAALRLRDGRRDRREE